MKCPFCDQKISYGVAQCENCGAVLPDQIRFAEPPAPSSSEYAENDFRNFTGRNAEYYIGKFKIFEAAGGKFEATWHWPAFFVGFWWFLYRRLYLWALFILAIGWIPFFITKILGIEINHIAGSFFYLVLCFIFGITMNIVWGISANYIYYKRAKKKMAEINNLYPSQTQRPNELARAGGVNRIAVILPVTIFIIIFLAAFLFPIYLFIYKPGCCETAQTRVRMAYIAAQTFFIKNPNTNLSDIKQLAEFGFHEYIPVNMKLINGSSDNLIISSLGRFCNKTYYIDYSGKISETMPAPPIAQAVAPPLTPPAVVAPPTAPPAAVAPAPSPSTPVSPAVASVNAADIVKHGGSSAKNKSGHVSIDDVDAVPYLNERGKKVYREEFLPHPSPKALVFAKNGAFTISYGGNDVLGRALQSCRDQFHEDCEPYAVDNEVIWKKPPGSYLPRTRVALPDSSAASRSDGADEVLVNVGDTVDDVKRIYNITAEPQPEKSTKPGTTALNLKNMGLWFFFDQSRKIYVIRLDPPFRGSIKGISIGDSEDKVLELLGQPDNGIPGSSASNVFYRTEGLHLLYNTRNNVQTIFLFK